MNKSQTLAAKAWALLGDTPCACGDPYCDKLTAMLGISPEQEAVRKAARKLYRDAGFSLPK